LWKVKEEVKREKKKQKRNKHTSRLLVKGRCAANRKIPEKKKRKHASEAAGGKGEQKVKERKKTTKSLPLLRRKKKSYFCKRCIREEGRVTQRITQKNSASFFRWESGGKQIKKKNQLLQDWQYSMKG